MHAYRARLCLIQVSTEDRDWVVDPLKGLDLDPFFAILEDPKVEKIFHDAEFDVLLLRRSNDVRLKGLFDTKVVATALGETQFGLAALVEKHFDVVLDKSQQRSDWGKRPLDAKQIRYAADDTHYLHELSDILHGRLEESEDIVRHEVEAEFRRLEALAPKADDVDPDAWAKVKGAHRLEPLELRALRDLWRWRESQAERRDVPPFKVIGNAQLLGLSRSRPSDTRGLARVQGIGTRLIERHGATLLRLIRETKDKPGIQMPSAPKRTPQERRERSEDSEVLDRLKRWRKRVAEQRRTDASLVMHREVLERLARLRPRPTSVEELAATGDFEDWRLEAHAEDLLAILADFVEAKSSSANQGASASKRKRAAKSRAKKDKRP